jgi:hypothetical protein
MRRAVVHITIGKLVFEYANELQIESSWKEFTDTAVIKLPRNLKLKEEELLILLKVGDQVVIKMGYEGAEMNTEFLGYLTSIKPNTPLEVNCEDESWVLKKEPITKTFKKTTVLQMIGSILPSYEVSGLDSEISSMVLSKSTPAQVLEKLKESYGLNSFFRLKNEKPVLVIGKPYSSESDEYSYSFGEDILAHNLEYKRKEDIKLKVTAISNNKNGSKTELQLGDADGEELTLNFYDVSKSTLQELATVELEKMKYDGYRGTMTVSGWQQANHGDVVKLIDTIYPERGGRFFIEKTSIKFGSQGFIRELTLGPKAS